MSTLAINGWAVTDSSTRRFRPRLLSNVVLSHVVELSQQSIQALLQRRRLNAMLQRRNSADQFVDLSLSYMLCLLQCCNFVAQVSDLLEWRSMFKRPCSGVFVHKISLLGDAYTHWEQETIRPALICFYNSISYVAGEFSPLRAGEVAA